MCAGLQHNVIVARMHKPRTVQANGKRKPKNDPAVMVGLSESTIRGHLAHLKAALRWAHKLGLLVEVPKFDLPRRAKKSGKASPMKGRPITAEELERMLARVREVVVDDA